MDFAIISDFFFKKMALLNLLAAAKNTLLLTMISMPLALTIGLTLALMRMSPKRLLSWPASAYIEVMRGTPLLVQVYLINFSLAELGLALHTDLLTLRPFTTGIICLSANYAAYEAEIHRAGLQAIDKGQREAALSIGMTPMQSFFLIVLPQAFRVILPPVINDLIAMLKDTSLLTVIGVAELLDVAKSIGRERGTSAEILVVAAFIYLVLSLACFALGKYVERRLKVKGVPELQMGPPRH